MKKYFFEYEVKKENNYFFPDKRNIDVCVQWGGGFYSTDGRPIVYVTFPLLNNGDLRTVINWSPIIDDCEKIGEAHFAEMAKEARIKEAQAVLNEFTNPVLERMAPAY